MHYLWTVYLDSTGSWALAKPGQAVKERMKTTYWQEAVNERSTGRLGEPKLGLTWVLRRVDKEWSTQGKKAGSMGQKCP